MFKWLKSDPVKALQKEFEKKSELAFNAQRNGKLELFGSLTKECEEIQEKIKSLKKSKTAVKQS